MFDAYQKGRTHSVLDQGHTNPDGVPHASHTDNSIRYCYNTNTEQHNQVRPESCSYNVAETNLFAMCRLCTFVLTPLITIVVMFLSQCDMTSVTSLPDQDCSTSRVTAKTFFYIMVRSRGCSGVSAGHKACHGVYDYCCA